MGRVYFYVVARDFGFAPNPFHGLCTLATCKPGIRKTCQPGDWVVGVGGGRLNATGRCIFAMRVSQKLTYDEYWSGLDYQDKKPIRNGSKRMLVGDNIYHHAADGATWLQADSHHSNADGTVNLYNLGVDTSSHSVLISQHFFYFGNQAPTIPDHLLESIGFTNGRNYRVFSAESCQDFLGWLYLNFSASLNLVSGDPFDFLEGHKRYSVEGDRIS